MPRLISNIYDMADGPPRSGREAEERNLAARRQAWHKLGLVVIDPEDINDEWLRQAVMNLADKQYGRRAKARIGGGSNGQR